MLLDKPLKEIMDIMLEVLKDNETELPYTWTVLHENGHIDFHFEKKDELL